MKELTTAFIIVSEANQLDAATLPRHCDPPKGGEAI
jgi:hypothetical protein